MLELTLFRSYGPTAFCYTPKATSWLSCYLSLAIAWEISHVSTGRFLVAGTCNIGKPSLDNRTPSPQSQSHLQRDYAERSCYSRPQTGQALAAEAEMENLNDQGDALLLPGCSAISEFYNNELDSAIRWPAHARSLPYDRHE